MNANAEILLIQGDGSVVLQVRDDKPGITNPGLISSFGGHIENGEIPIDAALREINEETNLGVKPEQLLFYDKRKKTKAEYGEDWDVYYYVVLNVHTDDLEVFEGSGFTVIRNIEELRQAKTTKLLGEVLTDYFDGFRNYVFYPTIDADSRKRLYDEYLAKILEGHKPSTLSQPIVLTCTGFVASGKSTITAPLAELGDCVVLSSDKIRELFYINGFSFRGFRDFMGDIIGVLIARRYNVFLDFNIATNVHHLDQFVEEGYKPFILHANPPFEFIENKILTGSMKHELTFFAKDEHVYRSLLTYMDDHIEALALLKTKYDIWTEVDTSRSDLDLVIAELSKKFRVELQELSSNVIA